MLQRPQHMIAMWDKVRSEGKSPNLYGREADLTWKHAEFGHKVITEVQPNISGGTKSHFVRPCRVRVQSL